MDRNTLGGFVPAIVSPFAANGEIIEDAFRHLVDWLIGNGATAICVAGDNGRCTYGRIGTFCNYDACFKDEDCAAGEVCLCDGSLAGTGGGNACISADCHVDADCGAFACSPTLGSCGHYTNFVAYRCHRATDTCTIDAECGVGGYCAFDEVLGHWQCSTAECAG